MAFGINEIAKLTTGAKALTDSFSKAVGQTTKLGSAASSIGDQIGTTASSFSNFAGEASNAGGVMEMVTGALRGLGPEGEAVAIAIQAVVTAVTALVVTMYDLLRTTIAISQSKDALAATFAALSDGAKQSTADGLALVNAVSDLAASLPQSEGQVLAWAKSLMAAGIQGQAMERAVRSIASAEALMGKEGAAAAETLIKRFAMTAEIGGKLKLDRRLLSQMAAAGVSATALAAALGVPADKLSTMAIDATKLGDAFQKALTEKGTAALENMGLTWASISAKLHDGWEDLFEDMGSAARPLMVEIKSLFSEFFAGSSAMSATKGVLTWFLTGLFSFATKAVHAIHTLFLYIQIGALTAAIALAPIVNWFRRIYSNLQVLLGLKTALILLAAPFLIIVTAAALVAAAFIAVVVAVGALVGAIVAGVAWIIGAIEGAATSLGTSLGKWSLTAETAAGNFVSGLVTGIKNGVGAVIGAVNSLASSAANAFTASLGIKSPSRVMMRFGGYVAEGAAIGIRGGQGHVAAAAAGLGAATVGGASGAAQGGGAKGSLSVTVAPGAIVIQGAGKATPEMAEELFAAFMERLAMSQGLGLGAT